jgi:hypothetical protein
MQRTCTDKEPPPRPSALDIGGVDFGGLYAAAQAASFAEQAVRLYEDRGLLGRDAIMAVRRRRP